MKALIALSLFFVFSACTRQGGKGSVPGDEAPASGEEGGTTGTGSGSDTDETDKDYQSKNDKDVETENGGTAGQPTDTTGSTNDTNLPSDSSGQPSGSNSNGNSDTSGSTNDSGQPSGGISDTTGSTNDSGQPSGGSSGGNTDDDTDDDTDDNASPTDTDADDDGIADDMDVCPGEDDALQATRYKLTDADNDGYADGSLSAKVCASNTEYTLTLPQVVYSDCNSSDATKWQTLAYAHRDADGDGHSIASAGSICTGNALPSGYLENALGTTDCDDTNGFYHTVSTHYGYEEDATGSDRYTRASESTCVPSPDFGPISAYKEYRLVPEIVSAAGLNGFIGFFELGGKLYFRASTAANGAELWVTDGTLTGSSLVKDIAPGSTGSSLANFIKSGEKLFFTANDGSGVGLWKSDGTEAGTVKVKAGISPNSFTDVNGVLFFVADDGESGMELWKTDGTEAGTVMVKDINSEFNVSSNPTSLTNVNGTLFFAADDGSHGVELWKSNGTEAGTVMVKDIDPGLQSSPSDFVAIGSTLYFTAAVGSSSGRELWKSDGTSSGTVLVKDIYPGASSGLNGGAALLTAMNSTLYFRANDGTSGLELWKSDGTEAGTTMVKDINSSGDSSPSSLVAVNGTLFFTADNGIHGAELWKSDGTEAGTALVKDIRPGGDTSIMYPTAVGSLLYFRSDNGIYGHELWKSDGTEAGTILVHDINPGLSNSNPSSLTVFDSRLIFVATTPDGSRIHRTTEPMP